MAQLLLNCPKLNSQTQPPNSSPSVENVPVLLTHFLPLLFVPFLPMLLLPMLLLLVPFLPVPFLPVPFLTDTAGIVFHLLKAIYITNVLIIALTYR